MNMRSIVAFTDDNVTTVGCSYYNVGRDSQQTYTFKCSTYLAALIKVGDYVIAESKNGLGIVEVERIDTVADIDIDSDIEYKWAFQRVQTENLAELKQQEDDALKVLQAQRRAAMRQQVIQSLAAGDSKFLIDSRVAFLNT